MSTVYVCPARRAAESVGSLSGLGLDPHHATAARAREEPSATVAARPRVAIVVLAYNGLEDTLACLRSLSHVNWSSLDVFLVDNGSSDGTAEAVSRRCPDVTVVEHQRNVGFAEGNNIGIRRALDVGAEYVFLLNNDTTVASDAIAECVTVAQRHADTGAVCPLIYFSEPQTLLWYAGAVFDPRRARSGRVLGYREVDTGQFSDAVETERITGAAVLLPRTVLERVGLLDRDLFFLYEDVDWSLRARRAGYRVYLAPRARVWHRVSAAAGGEHSPTIAYYDARNHIVVCRRHSPLTGAAALGREFQILLIHLAGARRARRPIAYVGAVLRGWRDGRGGRLGPRQ
jgi:GT2 family glycosyltransferase